MAGPKPTPPSSARLRKHEDPCETAAVAGSKKKSEEAEVDDETRSDETGIGEDGTESVDGAGDDESAEVAERSLTSASTRTARARATDEHEAQKLRTDREKRDQPALPLGPIAHLAFVILAAIGVYSFVSVAKEGELRRRCTPTCILRPNYAGYEKKVPVLHVEGHAWARRLARQLSRQGRRPQLLDEDVPALHGRDAGDCRSPRASSGPMKDVAVVTVSTDETAQEATDTIKAVLKGEPPFPDPDGSRSHGRARSVRHEPLSGDVDHRQGRRHPRALRRSP